MNMQLRTVKKPKNKAFEYGTNAQPEQTGTRKNSMSKETIEKEGAGSSNEVIFKII